MKKKTIVKVAKKDVPEFKRILKDFSEWMKTHQPVGNTNG